jgi:hypothetical protein
MRRRSEAVAKEPPPAGRVTDQMVADSAGGSFSSGAHGAGSPRLTRDIAVLFAMKSGQYMGWGDKALFEPLTFPGSVGE